MIFATNYDARLSLVPALNRHQPLLAAPAAFSQCTHFLPSRRCRSGRCRCRHYPAMFAILHSLPRPQGSNLALPPPAWGMRHAAREPRFQLEGSAAQCSALAKASNSKESERVYFQNKSATISLNEYHIKFNDAAVFQFSFRFFVHTEEFLF